jgi:hypothetical protein
MADNSNSRDVDQAEECLKLSSLPEEAEECLKLSSLPPDVLFEIAFRLAQPPRTFMLSDLARSCVSIAAVVRSEPFWARMSSAADEASEHSQPRASAASTRRDAFVAARRRERDSWQGLLRDARVEDDGDAGATCDEVRYSWPVLRDLSRAFSISCARDAAPDPCLRLASLLEWACAVADPLAVVCALMALDESALFAGGRGAAPRMGELFADASARRRSLPETTSGGELAALPIRVLRWSLGGKDLRGFRCRDDLQSVSLTLGELADPESVPDARTGLDVLERGVVYEVRRIALEVPAVAVPLPSASGRSLTVMS